MVLAVEVHSCRWFWVSKSLPPDARRLNPYQQSFPLILDVCSLSFWSFLTSKRCVQVDSFSNFGKNLIVDDHLLWCMTTSQQIQAPPPSGTQVGEVRILHLWIAIAWGGHNRIERGWLGCRRWLEVLFKSGTQLALSRFHLIRLEGCCPTPSISVDPTFGRNHTESAQLESSKNGVEEGWQEREIKNLVWK